MTTQIIPREVLWAQSFMLAKSLNNLNAVTGAKLWDGDINGADIFNTWVTECDSALSPVEDYQYYGSIEELSALRREDVGRSGLLLYRANIKLVKPVLFSLGLAALVLPSSVIAGWLNAAPVVVDVAKGAFAARTLFGVNTTQFSEAVESFKIVSKDDYPYAQAAVRLSCNNAFGLCLEPDAFSAEDLSRNLRDRASDRRMREEDAAEVAKLFIEDLAAELDEADITPPCDLQRLQSALSEVLAAVSGLLNAGGVDWDACLSEEDTSVAACEEVLRRLASPKYKMFSCTPTPGGSLEYRFLNF